MIACLAVPRLMTALALLPGSAALELVEAGTQPAEAGLIRAIEAQTAALQIMPRAGPHLSTAYLGLSLAEAGTLSTPQEAELLEVARHHLDEALAMAPAQPRGWFMLAGLRLRDDVDVDASTALALSFAANPHVPALGPFRWPMALGLSGRLSRETREQANLEFLSFFRIQPEAAVRIALRQNRLAELGALASELGQDRERFSKVIKRLRSGGA